VTFTLLVPSSQCAAVRKTVEEISVPVHSAQVTSEKACCASSAPTSGCRLWSGCPLVIFAAGAAMTSEATATIPATSFLMASSAVTG
jgi:hypothetical protein